MFKKSLLFVSFFSITAWAVQEIQVDVIDQNFNSSNKIVIDQDQIRKSHAVSLPQLLSSQANISVASTSFQPNSIYIRGGDSSHVLILVDGVPTYDPSTVQRTINLGNLNLKNIKKIEILKGSQSVIYGGQALSGVIKIETFSGQFEDKTEMGLQVGPQYGEFQVGRLQNLNQNWKSSLNVKALDQQADSPVLNSTKTYPQKVATVDGAIAYLNPDKNTEFITRINYSDDKNEIATTNFATFKAADTDAFEARTKTYGVNFVFRNKDLYQFSVSDQWTQRLFLQSAVDAGGTATDQDYKGNLIATRLDGRIYQNDFLSVLSGLSFTNESMKYVDSFVVKSDDINQYEGIYLKTDFKLPADFLFEVGARLEASKAKKIDQTYQAGVSWKDHVKLEYATGFKTPSLFQLYSSYGNTSLQPEKAKNTTLSFENKFANNILGSITFFDAQFENLIVIKGSPQRYENVSATRTQGVELYTSYDNPEQQYRAALSLGYQEPKDLSLDNWLVRRPLRTASLRLSKKVYDQFNLATEVNHTGDRRDRGAAGGYVTLEEYTLVNLIAELNVNPQLSYFTRIENLQNKTYQTAYGFYNQGVNIKFGLEAQF